MANAGPTQVPASPEQCEPVTQGRDLVTEKTVALLTLPEEPLTYSLEDVEQALGVKYSPEEKAALANCPFSKVTLKACAGTHMLFPGVPLSLLEIREKRPDSFQSKSGGWYEEDEYTFSRAPVPVRWHLLRMEPVPESFDRNWDEQCKLLLSDEVVPAAALVAYATILHHRVSGERLFEPRFVRTSDPELIGRLVLVGSVGGRLTFATYWDEKSHAGLGLASSRIP